MSSAADWFVVAGFFLVAMGVFLRTFIMMRSNDSLPAKEPPAGGRILARHYKSAFPRSRLPLLTKAAFGVGGMLLIAGVLLEFR